MAIRSPNGRQLYRSCARVVLLQKSGTRHFSLQPHQPAPGHLLPLSGQHPPVSRERFARYTGRFFSFHGPLFLHPLFCLFGFFYVLMMRRRPTWSQGSDDRPGRQTQTTDPVAKPRRPTRSSLRGAMGVRSFLSGTTACLRYRMHVSLKIAGVYCV